MKSYKNLLVTCIFLLALKENSGNLIRTDGLDPNSFKCYDEYTCNGCGIIEVTVNGNTCQVCTCGEQFNKIKTEIFPFTRQTTRPTRASRAPITTTTDKTTETTTKPTTEKTTNPSQFLCTEEYDCSCGIIQISANGKTCQVCSCGEQYRYFMQNIRPFLSQSLQRITRTLAVPNQEPYVCFDEQECSCGTFNAFINGKMCRVCLCGKQIEHLANKVIPYLVVTRGQISTSSTLHSAASFSCAEEYSCANNCGIVQITTLKNTCQVCGCGDQYRYFMNFVYPYMKTLTTIVTGPTRASRTTIQSTSQIELTCYDETECSCKMLRTNLNGKTCRICKCGDQIETLIEKILPKMRPNDNL